VYYRKLEEIIQDLEKIPMVRLLSKYGTVYFQDIPTSLTKSFSYASVFLESVFEGIERNWENERNSSNPFPSPNLYGVEIRKKINKDVFGGTVFLKFS
jgi:hypothetical protein